MEIMLSALAQFQLSQLIMIVVGIVLIWLAISKKYEPALLLPIGFGTILTNIPMSAAIGEHGPLTVLFKAGIDTELFPLLIFIAIGAMIDFTPLLKNPFMLLFGAAAQFGIFVTIVVAAAWGFDIKEAASIGIIGAADGPTSIYVANRFAPNLLGPISVAAYSYMALVPIIQPPVIKALTTSKERKIRMDYHSGDVSQTVKILFPIAITIVAGIFVPASLALIGFLMFGNLLRECKVLDSLSKSAQNELGNIVTILLGITIASKMQGEYFLRPQTLFILVLGLVAFIFDTAGGVLFAKLLNLLRKDKVNPMIGACGISAFPMSARVIHQMGQKEDPFNFLLMPAVSVNVGGQISSVIAGGIILSLLA
ncbi:MAG: sodium ion-translocating decarboxylase subunit beta [Candidatus Cloacimonadaceae bacterium]|jgi:oxaloacetate decarboxylase beta subunit|nr:sodium ion-translocating decarboxylase subunit beta [Candidatus Cloacimonadota bacterium]MCB5277412.1 sodium ion-translocating decarboxylase subunit beta [Candidatus Cloacimonadota bacterium]MDD2616798.1 sodium ion-translocating decarboxylase subunit beta [Candidatus Cloacimonadota bacterium]MDD2718751.1 sodium ion-translocating decarboxylase subunit beta [Candidatus Cloacimonadota bacterium]MDD3548162.1 sodium ion-translocating decarboxylase subunit beta [Candidatus Cloacimonadota bacterium